MPRQAEATIDYRGDARSAGLTYVVPDDRGIGRRRAGRGFSYHLADGSTVRDPAVLRRIRALVIPPAWNQVWICPDPQGHLQAVGEDERGRRQYLYHPRFREVREGVKFEHMIAFAETLPAIRRQVSLDMAGRGLAREKVLATVVHLLETTMVRVGNAAYVRENKSYGLTTLQARHVKVDGADLRFHFKGKSGKTWRLSVHDRRVARIVKNCQELPGQHLFQYLDHEGQRQTVSSADINAYLKAVSGADITAKDFRTWTGTVLAAMALAELGCAESPASAKRGVAAAIGQVATRLGNTPAICRKCYVHPEILTAYLDGGLRLGAHRLTGEGLQSDPASLTSEEVAVLKFLRDRAASAPASQRAA